MTISIWRYSHLVLAVSSFIFITLASVTGIILSFKPVTEKVQPYRAKNFNQLTLAEAIPNLKKSFTDVSEVTIDANQFVVVNGTDLNDESGHFYVDPRTGKILVKVGKEREFFKWVTSFHRSLFLHETGRIFVGLTAFLLFLIATTGTILIIQRQQSFKRFFAKIVRDNFFQYYHVLLGRLLLIPILIITLTGSVLSLSRFGIIKEQKITHKVDFDAIKSSPQKKLSEIELFKNTKLADVQSLEFPFSEDVEDYFTIKLKDRELTLNQVTGDVLTEHPYAMATLLHNLSMDLHTGRGSAVWAIILAIASLNILFFIYSGFAITLKRRANRIKNKFKFDQAEFVILVGSENGTTFRFANVICQQLLEGGKSVFMAELNDYKIFPRAKHIIVFTATYGLGDAPTNASKFFKLLEKHQQNNKIYFSVVAFGSHAYPDFCKFGFEVNNRLAQQTWAKALTEIHTVNDRSPDDFSLWANVWSQSTDVPLNISPKLLVSKPTRQQHFTVVNKTVSVTTETSFIIRLRQKRNRKFSSGDLLAIYPANDHRERLYSIGKVGKDVQLSVKLHEGGLGSGFLHQLEVGQSLFANITPNPHFHFPSKAKTIVMVSNGTGIAPFLGMIDQNVKARKIHLYCGFRTQASFELYQNAIQTNLETQKLTALQVAYSREGEKQYVKDLLHQDSVFIFDTLKHGGVMMLCGSLSMQNDVIEELNAMCKAHDAEEMSFYQSHGQMLMDCY